MIIVSYSGKISQGSIFVGGWFLPFRGVNFRECVHSGPLCTVPYLAGLIFMQLGDCMQKWRKLDPSNISCHMAIIYYFYSIIITILYVAQ